MALKIHDVERAFPVRLLVRTYLRRQAFTLPSKPRFIEGSLARRTQMVFPRPALEPVRTLMAVGSSLAFVGEHLHRDRISAEKRYAHIIVVVKALYFLGKLL